MTGQWLEDMGLKIAESILITDLVKPGDCVAAVAVQIDTP